MLLTPKWIGLTVLLVVVVAGCVVLGAWQWGRIQQGRVIVQPSSDVRVPVTDLFAPGEPLPSAAVGVPVTVSGRYDPAAQLLVPGRRQDEAAGYWVLTPLVTGGGDLIPVVRGWSPTAAGPALAPPSGRVLIEGRLLASEGEGLRRQSSVALPDGQVEIVNTAELLSLWEGDLYQGFVALSDQDPTSALAPVDLPTQEKRPISWQSLAYTVQWWLFAAFAVFFWVRMLQADLADQRSARRADGTTGHDGPQPPHAAEFSEVRE